jgi:hypothetical protein
MEKSSTSLLAVSFNNNHDQTFFCKFQFDATWSTLDSSNIKLTMISSSTNPSNKIYILAMKAKGTDLMHGLAKSYYVDDSLLYWIMDF